MGVSFEDALTAQAKIEDKLMCDPNVVSIGVIAETNELGEKTGDYAIQVGVISSEIYASSVRHGGSVIPDKYVIKPENGGEEKHIHICIVKTGEIKAQTLQCKKGDSTSLYNPIKAALSSLSPLAINKYPDRRSHRYDLAPPLSSIKNVRNYSTIPVKFPRADMTVKAIFKKSASLPVGGLAITSAFTVGMVFLHAARGGFNPSMKSDESLTIDKF
ncbi:MAG: hypothetical protein Q7V63_09075 [Gammaproteobacteria bacterium]|nr:hypothetical protein [Gammaproteobacteria bacterium]